MTTHIEPNRASSCCLGLPGMARKRQRDEAFEDRASTDEALTLLAKEMNQLSVQEREFVFEEIHGVSETQEETPEFVAASFEAMRTALGEIPKRKKTAYDRASFLKPSLSQDRDFHMMFLRADRYNPVNAAQRLVKYFELKRSLFDDDKLVKKITSADLDPDDWEVSKCGGLQVLPQKDRAGRLVWFHDLRFVRFKTPDNFVSLLRTSLYETFAAFSSESHLHFTSLASIFILSFNEHFGRGQRCSNQRNCQCRELSW